MSTPDIVASELYPSVYKFLIECGHNKTAKAFLKDSRITINNTNPGYYRGDINFLFFCAPNTTYYVGLLDTGINGTTAINSIAATYCSLNTTFTMSNTSQTFSLSGIIYVDSANNWTNGPTSYTSGVLNLMLAAKSTGTAYMFWSIDIQRIS